MSFPAFTTFFADPDRTPARICVWMAIQPPLLDFAIPRPLKVDAVATTARISTRTAVDTINWMIDRGYLVVHRQDGRGVRDVTIAYATHTATVDMRQVKHG